MQITIEKAVTLNVSINLSKRYNTEHKTFETTWIF